MALSRTELDARGTSQSPTTFWEKVVAIFNDETCVFESSCLDSSWGGRFFLEKIPLGWDSLHLVSVEKLDSPNTAKQKYMKLTNAVGNIYQRWKRSGTGEGHADDRSLSGEEDGEGEGRDGGGDIAENLQGVNTTTNNSNEQDENIVAVTRAIIPLQAEPRRIELAAVGGYDRFNFIGGENPAAMYLWHHLEYLGLFGHASDQVTTPFQTDNNQAPNPTATRKEKKRKEMSAAAMELTSMLRNLSKKHEDGIRKIQASQRKLVFVQEKKASLHEKRLQMERSKVAYDQLCQSFAKAQESMDRAMERADDEDCEGNTDRRDRWLATANQYRVRCTEIAKRIRDCEEKLEGIIDARSSEVCQQEEQPVVVTNTENRATEEVRRDGGGRDAEEEEEEESNDWEDAVAVAVQEMDPPDGTTEKNSEAVYEYEREALDDDEGEEEASPRRVTRAYLIMKEQERARRGGGGT